MKYGIYYPYWLTEWDPDCIPFVERVKRLGFDILEIPAQQILELDDEYLLRLKALAEKTGVKLTGGYGPDAEHEISSADPAIVKAAFEKYEAMFKKLHLAGIKKLGGGLYSYWPVDYSRPIDKAGDLQRSIENMRTLADIAAEYDLTLGMESLNRFEGYLINICEECVEYVDKVNRPNVKVMLDVFHMSIEEDSFTDAIKLAGDKLGHLHLGEANRRPPHAGGRIPWAEIGQALHEIGYDGDVVMEPFVRQGGTVGSQIKIWHDPLKGTPADQLESRLDADAAASVKFLRDLWG